MQASISAFSNTRILLFTRFFGIARTFGAAIAFRSLLGFSNGIVGTAKTAVSELANGNETLETRGMGLVMGMWGWGFLFSPALSGALAEPVRAYPNAKWVKRFEGILSKYPFLLPNIVGAGLCILSLIAVNLCVQETLPREKLQSPRLLFRDCVERCTCVCGKVLSRQQNVSQEQEYDTLAQDDVLPIKDIELTNVGSSAVEGEEDKEDDVSEIDRSYYNLQNIRLQHTESCMMLSTTTKPPSILLQQEVRQSDLTSEATLASLWSRFDTRRHLIVYWVYSFITVSLDEAFPLFCISKQAGLGLSEASIGKILSGSGLIFAICQYFAYTAIVNRFGLYGSIKLGSVMTVPLIALIPLSLLLNNGTEGGNLTWATFCYLSILMALSRVFGIAFYSSIAITTNRTVLASHRASMNGLSMLGGSIAKGAGPAFAGCLVAFSLSSGVFSPHVGAAFVFAVLSFLAFMVAMPSATLVNTTSTVHDSDANNEER
jgi:MFS family permease